MKKCIGIVLIAVLVLGIVALITSCSNGTNAEEGSVLAWFTRLKGYDSSLQAQAVDLKSDELKVLFSHDGLRPTHYENIPKDDVICIRVAVENYFVWLVFRGGSSEPAYWYSVVSPDASLPDPKPFLVTKLLQLEEGKQVAREMEDDANLEEGFLRQIVQDARSQ